MISSDRSGSLHACLDAAAVGGLDVGEHEREGLGAERGDRHRRRHHVVALKRLHEQRKHTVNSSQDASVRSLNTAKSGYDTNTVKVKSPSHLPIAAVVEDGPEGGRVHVDPHSVRAAVPDLIEHRVARVEGARVRNRPGGAPEDSWGQGRNVRKDRTWLARRALSHRTAETTLMLLSVKLPVDFAPLLIQTKRTPS